MKAEDRRHLDESGYLVLSAHFDLSRAVLAHVETLFEQAGENVGHELRAEPFARTAQIALDESGLFAPLTRDLPSLECVEHLLGPRLELATLLACSTNPFALALNPLRSGPGSSACRVLWLLDNFTDEGVAALRVAPGSHLVDSSHAERPAVSLSAPAGSAVVLNGRLWSGDASNPGHMHLRTLRCEYVDAKRDSG